jgi:hypothetical protein
MTERLGTKEHRRRWLVSATLDHGNRDELGSNTGHELSTTRAEDVQGSSEG